MKLVETGYICGLGLPPDPINHVCSLTGKYISRKHFIYRPVQIFKIMFRRFFSSRIWSSAQDHVLLVLLLNLVGFFISTRPRWSGENDLYHSRISFEGASRGGQPLNLFTWFIGAGGLIQAGRNVANPPIVPHPLSSRDGTMKEGFPRNLWNVGIWE